VAAHCEVMTTHQNPIDQQSPAIYAGHEVSGISFVLVAKPSTGDLTHSQSTGHIRTGMTQIRRTRATPAAPAVRVLGPSSRR
jgi:hypothetical protein